MSGKGAIQSPTLKERRWAFKHQDAMYSVTDSGTIYIHVINRAGGRWIEADTASVKVRQKASEILLKRQQEPGEWYDKIISDLDEPTACD